ncbi:hypothetical protein LTR85_005403 [Meristemomyces frigidus]|nr:hypothetical protein LTR85_005403 [Meristemomyces frigidus]
MLLQDWRRALEIWCARMLGGSVANIPDQPQDVAAGRESLDNLDLFMKEFGMSAEESGLPPTEEERGLELPEPFPELDREFDDLWAYESNLRDYGDSVDELLKDFGESAEDVDPPSAEKRLGSPEPLPELARRFDHLWASEPTLKRPLFIDGSTADEQRAAFERAGRPIAQSVDGLPLSIDTTNGEGDGAWITANAATRTSPPLAAAGERGRPWDPPHHRLWASEWTLPRSPFFNGSIAGAEDVVAKQKGRAMARSVGALLNIVAGSIDGDQNGGDITSGVTQISPPPSLCSSSRTAGIAAHLLQGRSTPPPDTKDPQYFTRYADWRACGPGAPSRSSALQRSPNEKLGSLADRTPARQSILASQPGLAALAASGGGATGDSANLPALHLADGMRSVDPWLMQHLREAHDKGTGKSEYSAETAGGLWARWDAPNARIPVLQYGAKTPPIVAAQELAEVVVQCDGDDDDEQCDDDHVEANAKLDELEEAFEPTLKRRDSESDDGQKM